MTATLIQFPQGRAQASPPSRRPTINNRQKALLHIYAKAAGLSQGEYRAILVRSARCPSAADPRFGQREFDAAMAALEGELAVRVETNRVPPPPPRRIPRLDYWRSRGSSSPGRVNIRQRHAIEETWSLLARYIGTAATQEYLLGIIHKATGRRVLPHQLSSAQAGQVIDALKSRLAAAVRATAVPEAGAGAPKFVAGVGDPGPVVSEAVPGKEEPCPF